jgi:hypothetical protein
MLIREVARTRIWRPFQSTYGGFNSGFSSRTDVTGIVHDVGDRRSRDARQFRDISYGDSGCISSLESAVGQIAFSR